MTRQIVSLIIALLLHTVVLYLVSGYPENNGLAAGGEARSLQITMSGISRESGPPEDTATTGITGSVPRQNMLSSEVLVASPSEPQITENSFSEINASAQKISLPDAPVSTTSNLSETSVVSATSFISNNSIPENTISKRTESRDNPSSNQAFKKESSMVQRSIMDQPAAPLSVVQNQEFQVGTMKMKDQSRTVAAVGSTPQATVGQSKSEVEGSKSAAVGSSSLKQQAEQLEANYRTELVNAISRYKRYPMRARKKGNEGDVVVAFTIEKDGRITGIAVVESSSWSALDKAAVKALEKLNRFKPIPDSFFRKQWSFQIPIKFSLQS
ncbi:energy transducer TonB [Motiliproteus sp. MSK22-1]|uniref:energy transducer TonB n=1 Tax=Motiliproteus sp. MSK22-1 TaxID=1897630 RepID=UPI001300CBFB|nr:energy transducer TonB [Motiliproteus sp. MSK22-1]